MDQPPPFLKKLSERNFAIVIALIAAALFYFSTKAVQRHFDYTYRIALALLEGHVGLSQKPPSWLNEMVPFEGKFYSVFPLGAVLANLPIALLQKLGLFREWPAHGWAALIAGGCVYFFYRLSHIAEMSRPRRVLVALFPIFATWAWCNLGFAGAWQMALGFAMLGQAGALYYTLVRPSPVLAGLWFAVAFGNRTELVVTLPAYLYLWLSRPGKPADDSLPAAPESIWHRLRAWRPQWTDARRIIAWPKGREVARFLAMPAILLLLTAAYNLVRFDSVADFGYERIPGVMKEPWYQNGLFSLTAIKGNVHEMLFRNMLQIPKFPYYQPHAFGCSIFFSCPFLFFLFREGGKYKAVCWLTIAVLTFILWCHGNAGGWQFSYRYAMILLPWIFVIIAGNGPRRLTPTEGAIFLLSVFINGMAMYQFLWTHMIHV